MPRRRRLKPMVDAQTAASLHRRFLWSRDRWYVAGLPWTSFSGCFRLLSLSASRASPAGVVHKDIKPENIFLGSNSSAEVKLTGFGAASRVSREPQALKLARRDKIGVRVGKQASGPQLKKYLVFLKPAEAGAAHRAVPPGLLSYSDSGHNGKPRKPAGSLLRKL